MSRLSIDTKASVFGALLEGASIRSTERQTGVTSVNKRAETGNPDMSRATTSHVESAHLHFRMRNKRAARLSNAFSKSLEHLRAATAIYYAHYNLVRRHSSIKSAPAVAAGLIDRPWTLHQLIEWGSDYGTA